MPMKKPLISIIVPVYNVKNFLRECLDSILAQTLTDWEAILVDDGSTDGSGEICDEYAAADARFTVIHKENTGQADSRNIAISQAKADCIGFVDSDDWIEPRMYEILYNTMVENGADISICGYFFNYVNKERAYYDSGETIIMSGKEAMEEVIDDKIIHSYLWDKLFKKEMITEPLPKSYYYYRQRKGSTDHDTDPLKRYHFFRAEKDRVEYIKKTNLIPDRWRKMEVRLVKTGVQQIKEIARLSKRDEVSMHYIEQIRKEIKPMLPVKAREYGLKRYLRLYTAQNHLRLYFNAMRIEKYLSTKYLLNTNVYYE